VTIESITIQRLRILKHAHLQPSLHVNLITGPNAAGKTSLLEAIDILSRGRSFRAYSVEKLLRFGETSLTIVARLRQTAAPALHVGLERSRAACRVRINGVYASSIAELTRLLPVQVLHPESHQLIQGGPGSRRAYLDWGVFHVEPAFIRAWRHYRRALSQRNAALRADSRAARDWDSELADAGHTIDRHRCAYMASLGPLLMAYGETLLGTHNLEVVYRRGWAEDVTLAEMLARTASADAQRGYTGFGPHRADIELHFEGRNAGAVVSRGQQKLLAAALILAQVRLFLERTGRPCVLLVDDLPAELQAENRKRLLAELTRTGAQIFITAIDRDLLDLSAWADHKRFHVEQGQVQELI
jgi:DNA replication and repair protein RecF